jgi:hypothetical protein
MSKIVIVVLLYRRHKSIDLILCICSQETVHPHLRSRRAMLASTQAVKCNWGWKYRFPFLSNAMLVSGSKCVLRVLYLWNRWLFASLIFVWSLASDSASWGITFVVTRGSSAAMDSANSLTLVLQEKVYGWMNTCSVHEYTRRGQKLAI